LSFHSTAIIESVIARLQADAKDSLKKRLRQEMVRRKILNQSAVLVAAGSDGAATLKEIARHVEPRDQDNVEARAARFYWSRLFTEFTRDDPAFQGVAPLATYHGEIGSEPTA
jgi:CRISP-associated protein Cas1